MKLLYLSYVNMKDTSGPSINESSFLKCLKDLKYDVVVISGDSTELLNTESALPIPRLLKKIINYISYMLCVLLLPLKKSKMLDNRLLVMRLGPLPIAESILVYFFKPKFVIKTLGSGNISWNSGLKFVNKIHLKLYKFLSNKCLMIDTVTELSKKEIIKSLDIKDESMVQVIDNGVDTSKFNNKNKIAIRTKYSFNHYECILGYTGNYGSVRGAEEAIRATANLNESCINTGCIVLGFDPNQKKLEELSLELGISDKVHFFGSVTYDLVPEITSMLDIGFSILPKESSAASPQKVRQYVASGVLVISTRGNDNFIEKINCGCLVDFGDMDAINKSVRKLIDPMFLPDKKLINNYVNNLLSLSVGIKIRLKFWSKLYGI